MTGETWLLLNNLMIAFLDGHPQDQLGFLLGSNSEQLADAFPWKLVLDFMT